MMKTIKTVSLQALFYAGLIWLGLMAANSATAAPHLPLDPVANGILFIENNVEDFQRLATEASSSLEVVVLDAQKDGLQQIATALTGRKDVPAVHLISHGSSGSLNLGQLSLDREALQLRHQDLATMRKALRGDAELFLYGCDVAQGSDGRAFVSALSEALSVQVAASINATGDGARGGDWNLEHRTTDAMRTEALAFPSYAGLLPSVSGTVAINNPGDWVNYGTTLNDSESDNGDIAGISYDLFFGDSSGNPTGTVATFNNGLGSIGSVLILDTGAGAQTNENSYSFIAKSQMGKFRLTSFLIQDYYGMNSNYLATPYLNGVPSGAAYPFTIAQSGGYARTVMLPAQFNSVTEVRITSDGGNSPQPGARNIWQGFNNFVFADPIFSTNSDLAGLALSSVSLTPGFGAGTTSYTASVGNATTSITVSPSVWDANRATVMVNGVSVISGNASGAIALNVGANTITTVVTAEDGSTTKTYTITVTRAAPSNNANLSALSLSSGTLTPGFASGTTSYTASVANATNSITVTPTVADNTASITVNGVATTNGNASGAIALAVGSNTVTVLATAQDGTMRTYTVTVTRAASANADLSALSLSSGTLSPAFASGTSSYTASVSNATTSLTLTPTVADASASVTVNGLATTSGNASGAIALAVGSNTITTVVTAQNGGTTKTYTVTVTRAASSNANLSALSSSSGTLSPPFVPTTTSYTFSIGAAVSSITITPTVADSTASVTVNGVAVTSGAASGAIAMNTGANTVTTVVTAQNGTTKTYTATVTRAVSVNNDLAALSLSSGTLSPVFSAAQQTYSANVPNANTSITVTPTVVDSSATVTVNGVAVTSGAPSGAIALNTGLNVIVVTVTAQDGSPRSYTISVTRSNWPTTVSGMSPSGGGTVTATLSGPAGCGFDSAAFIGLTGSPGSPPSSPSNYTFAQGLFDVKVAGCPTSATVTITLVYPQPFAPGSAYMKYGPTTTNIAAHWHVFPGATINGNTVTLTLTDGANGDDDLVVNGSIVDPGGVALALAPAGAVGIPTLSQWGMILLSMFVLCVGFLTNWQTTRRTYS